MSDLTGIQRKMFPNLKFLVFKPLNWKLTILAFLFFAIFIRLGFWQLSRAAEKQQLLLSYATRINYPALDASVLNKHTDIPKLLFYRVTLRGEYDNEHTILLDNKTYHGQVGYEIYTPFKVSHSGHTILIDRGFVALGQSRQKLPSIRAIRGQTTLHGMITSVPQLATLGKMNDANAITWPLRIEYVDTKDLSRLFGYPLTPFLITLDVADKAAYPLEWKIITMSPEKHKGYALQWFAFALTLLILFIALNLSKREL